MDKVETTDILIRAAEPSDAAAISALLGQVGTFEGTLQLPDMPVASRLDVHQRVDTQGCKLVALAQGEIIGIAGLHLQQPSLRRNHVRGLAIGIAPHGQGRGIGRMLMTRLLEWADHWSGVLRGTPGARGQRSRDRAVPQLGLYRGRPAQGLRTEERPLCGQHFHGAPAPEPAAHRGLGPVHAISGGANVPNRAPI